MEVLLGLLLCFAALGPCYGREEVTVDPDAGGGGGTSSGIDWSKLDYQNVYCTAPGKECPGGNLGAKRFAATARQCNIQCSVEPSCVSAFMDKSKMCQKKSRRCTMEELVPNPEGTDYYRLKKGESCPANRPQYEEIYKDFTNTFCVLHGKSCPGRDLYPKPQNIYPLEKCLQKCTRLKTCASVDFKNNKCSLKDYNCNIDELVEDPDNANAMRLEAHQLSCGPSRGLTCPDNSHADGSKCVCDVNYRMKYGRCILDCPANSKPVSGQCVCHDGFEMTADKTCEKPVPKDEAPVGKCVAYEPAFAYCNRYLLDCAGSDISHHSGVVSLEDCQHLCNYKTQCKSIFWRHDHNCWLKHKVCTKAELSRNLAGYDSVKIAVGGSCAEYEDEKVEYCNRRLLDCPGHDIEHITGVASLEDCQRLCSYNTECKSIFWRYDQNCWLKRTICENNGLTRNIAGTDSVKIAAGGSCAQYEAKFSYCNRQYMDCVGNDLAHVDGIWSLEDCQQLCSYQHDCKSIFWRRDGNCWLKSKVCSMQENTRNLAGLDSVKIAYGGSCTEYDPKFDYCNRHLLDCVGNDLEHLGGVHSLENCQQLCNYNSACKSIFWRTDGNCWLKNKVCTKAELSRNVAGYDSVKVAVGGSCAEHMAEADYCNRHLMDCVGSDLLHITGVPRIEDCQHLCTYESECKSIFWRYDQNCWLKNKACTLEELNRNVQGFDSVKIAPGGSCAPHERNFDYCNRRFLDCVGHDIAHLTGVDSLELCQKLCSFNVECQSIFWRQDRNCWLKRKVCTKAELTRNLAGYDSVKVDVGAGCAAYDTESNFCNRKLLDCVGHDIESISGVASLEHCQKLCSYNAECKSVFWTPEQGGICWLKTKVCTMAELTINVSGFDSYKIAAGATCEDHKTNSDYCNRHMLDCVGSDIRHLTGVRSLRDCQLLCNYNSECKSIFWRHDQNCWLKNKVCTMAELTRNVDGYDSVKVVAGGSCAEYEFKHDYCDRRILDCPGFDLVHVTGIHNQENCKQLCSYNSACKAIFWRHDANCWLKHKVCTNDELVVNLAGSDSVKIA